MSCARARRNQNYNDDNTAIVDARYYITAGCLAYMASRRIERGVTCWKQDFDDRISPYIIHVLVYGSLF